MNRTFTSEEFYTLAIKPDGLDKDFLNKWNVKQCIRGCWWHLAPLQWAAFEGHLDIVKHLVQNNVDITAYDNYAVRCAAEYGHLDIVKYLVQNNADITADDNHAIRYAACNGYLDIVKYLVKKGADITARGNCTVQWAAMNGHLETVKYLVENGADITVNNNKTFILAALNNYVHVVKYLLSTNIYSEEFIHGVIKDPILKNDTIKELMLNYKKFSNTKACK